MMAESAIPIGDQSDDFLTFDFAGTVVEVDLFKAYDAMSKIDERHVGDPWRCLSCLANPIAVDVASERIVCPACQCADPQKVVRDEAWLDDVAAWAVDAGAPKCGRRAAAKIYDAIVQAMETAKKKLSQTPVLPTISA